MHYIIENRERELWEFKSKRVSLHYATKIHAQMHRNAISN